VFCGVKGLLLFEKLVLTLVEGEADWLGSKGCVSTRKALVLFFDLGTALGRFWWSLDALPVAFLSALLDVCGTCAASEACRRFLLCMGLGRPSLIHSGSLLKTTCTNQQGYVGNVMIDGLTFSVAVHLSAAILRFAIEAITLLPSRASFISASVVGFSGFSAAK